MFFLVARAKAVTSVPSAMLSLPAAMHPGFPSPGPQGWSVMASQGLPVNAMAGGGWLPAALAGGAWLP